MPATLGSFARLKHQRRGGAVRRDGLTADISKIPGVKTTSDQIPGAYVRAVLDPEGSDPAHIPDLCCYPSIAFTTREEISFLPAGGSGAHGGFTFDLAAFPRYRFETSATTDATFAYDTNWTKCNFSADMASRYQAVRLVGASVRMEFGGADSTNGGYVAALSLGRYSTNDATEADNTTAGTPLNITALRNTRDCYVGTYKNGLYITYRPLDATAFNFVTVRTPASDGTAQTKSWGQFIVHVSNCAGPSSMLYLTMHWEGIPSMSNTSSINNGLLSTVYTNDAESAPSQTVASQCPAIYSGDSYVKGFVSEVAKKGQDVVTSAIIGAGTALILGQVQKLSNQKMA